jgi:hypothetical protein
VSLSEYKKHTKMTSQCRRPSTTAFSVAITVLVCVTLDLASVEGREEPHKFTVDELLSTTFENKDSGDFGMDPCKAGKFSISTYLIAVTAQPRYICRGENSRGMNVKSPECQERVCIE